MSENKIERENLEAAVCAQMKQDMQYGDYTAISDLFRSVPDEDLRGFLSETDPVSGERKTQSYTHVFDLSLSVQDSHKKPSEVSLDNLLVTLQARLTQIGANCERDAFRYIKTENNSNKEY